MDVSAAHDLLGTDPAMSAGERRAAYQRQRQSLEAHLAQSSVPLLKERYRIAITRLDEAFAAIVIAGASDEIPVLRSLDAKSQRGPGLAPNAQPPSTAAIWRELPYAAGPAATPSADRTAEPAAAPAPATAPDPTPAAMPGPAPDAPALHNHPPTSSASIWRELSHSAAAAETPPGPPVPGSERTPAPAPAPSTATPAPPAATVPAATPAFTPTPSTALPFVPTGGARSAATATPATALPVLKAATPTPSRGAQVLTPTHAHVRVQSSRTPTQGAPVIPANRNTTTAVESGRMPLPRRPRARSLPWILLVLLALVLTATVFVRLMH